MAKVLLDPPPPSTRRSIGLIVGEEVTGSAGTLTARRQELKVTSYSVDVVGFQGVDPALASSLRRVQQYASAQEEIKVLTLVCLFGVATNSYAA